MHLDLLRHGVCVDPDPPSTIFDRFESEQGASADSLARDLADLLGARRLLHASDAGVLGYGLPPLSEITSKNESDKEKVGRHLRQAIQRYEPRLRNVRVTPVPNAPDFSFHLEADLVSGEGAPIALRILSPLTGGGLGAEVLVVDDPRR